MRVLIADDSPVQRAILKESLLSWGYEVSCATDGEAAFAILRQEDAPSLVILDWEMPGRDGIELCAYIRREKKPYIYTILVSGNTCANSLLHAFDVGADDYLRKPYHELELRARVRAGERIVLAQQEILKAREALHFEASHDFLTRRWNRRGILELTRKEIERCQRTMRRFGACLVDLDHFKQVNDCFGHLTGDYVLQVAAERMVSALREYDDVGRYGGEEFLILLPECETSQDSLAVAERVRTEIAARPILTREGQINLTVSIGTCCWEPGCELEDMLSRMDSALYTAKDLGRNRVQAACEHSWARGQAPQVDTKDGLNICSISGTKIN